VKTGWDNPATAWGAIKDDPKGTSDGWVRGRRPSGSVHCVMPGSDVVPRDPDGTFGVLRLNHGSTPNLRLRNLRSSNQRK